MKRRGGMCYYHIMVSTVMLVKAILFYRMNYTTDDINCSLKKQNYSMKCFLIGNEDGIEELTMHRLWICDLINSL